MDNAFGYANETLEHQNLQQTKHKLSCDFQMAGLRALVPQSLSEYDVEANLTQQTKEQYLHTDDLNWHHPHLVCKTSPKFEMKIHTDNTNGQGKIIPQRQDSGTFLQLPETKCNAMLKICNDKKDVVNSCAIIQKMKQEYSIPNANLFTPQQENDNMKENPNPKTSRIDSFVKQSDTSNALNALNECMPNTFTKKIHASSCAKCSLANMTLESSQHYKLEGNGKNMILELISNAKIKSLTNNQPLVKSRFHDTQEKNMMEECSQIARPIMGGLAGLECTCQQVELFTDPDMKHKFLKGLDIVITSIKKREKNLTMKRLHVEDIIQQGDVLDAWHKQLIKLVKPKFETYHKLFTELKLFMENPNFKHQYTSYGQHLWEKEKLVHTLQTELADLQKVHENLKQQMDFNNCLLVEGLIEIDNSLLENEEVTSDLPSSIANKCMCNDMEVMFFPFMFTFINCNLLCVNF
jgi:hypothetical protein